jgi:hypothetical protein
MIPAMPSRLAKAAEMKWMAIMIHPASQSRCWGVRLRREIEKKAKDSAAMATTSGIFNQSILGSFPLRMPASENNLILTALSIVYFGEIADSAMVLLWKLLTALK